MQGVDSGVTILGRYALHGPIARGGMATVHFGRLIGPVGFARTVAIKRLHPQYASDPEFVSMFVDEARLAARVRSPHVVPTVDVVTTGGELFLVMDYVPGESLSRLVRSAMEAGGRVPVRIAVSVASGVLRGLHAAHEARSERGEPLGIVHRDVSPQNVIVGTDGLARVLDFGVAKAAGRLQTTRDGQLKGKLAYMAPEQLRNQAVTRKADVYAASVVLWEVLTGERLFSADSEGALVTAVLAGRVEAPSRAVARASPEVDEETMHALEQLDPVVLRGLERDPARRFESAREMAAALEVRVAAAPAAHVGEWVERVAGSVLAERAARVAAIESEGVAPAPEPPSAAEPRTQASSISVATNADDSRTRREGKRAKAVLVAGAALAVLGVTLMVRSSRAPDPTAVHPLGPAAIAISPAPSIDDPAPSASVTLPSDTASSISLEAAAPTAAAPRAMNPARSSAPKPAVAPGRRKATGADCNPPFTWDALGKKHYKAECL